MGSKCQDDKITVSSSDESSDDSDKIDSDIEAELYSIVHHQQETCPLSADSESKQNDKDENLNYSITKSTTSNLEDPIILPDSFDSDRISDCELYKNFEYQNNSFSRNKGYQNSISSKRKSDTLTEDEPHPNSTAFPVSKIAKHDKSNRKIDGNISKNFKRNSCVTVTNNVDTSDSDSDIIFVESGDTDKFLETNVSVQNVQLNTDSEDSMPSFPFGSSFSFRNNSSVSHTNSTQSGNSEDLWFVNDEDLNRFKRNSGRYHAYTVSQCTNCLQKGHTAIFCSYSKSVKCFLCGANHNPLKCKKRTCSRCFKPGHDNRYCRKDIAKCANCEMFGHPHQLCPDIWRKYSLTTSYKFVVSERLPQDTPLYCYNCGLDGHFGVICNKKRMDNKISVTCPTIILKDLPDYVSFNKYNERLVRISDHKREKILLRRKLKKERQKAERQNKKTAVPIYTKFFFKISPKKKSNSSSNVNSSNSKDNSPGQNGPSQRTIRNRKRAKRLKKLKSRKKNNNAQEN